MMAEHPVLLVTGASSGIVDMAWGPLATTGAITPTPSNLGPASAPTQATSAASSPATGTAAASSMPTTKSRITKWWSSPMRSTHPRNRSTTS